MFQIRTITNKLTFFQKVKSFDYILLLCILIIGIISCYSMYSTDGGELLYHSKSHVIRFLVFFVMMIVLSFFSIRFWHSTGYLFYFIVLGLLLWALFYGITASGSQRWIDLYFINLQPSELMKIAIIICFAKSIATISNTNSSNSTCDNPTRLRHFNFNCFKRISCLMACRVKYKIFYLFFSSFYNFNAFCNFNVRTISKNKNINFL